MSFKHRSFKKKDPEIKFSYMDSYRSTIKSDNIFASIVSFSVVAIMLAIFLCAAGWGWLYFYNYYQYLIMNAEIHTIPPLFNLDTAISGFKFSVVAGFFVVAKYYGDKDRHLKKIVSEKEEKERKASIKTDTDA